MKTFKSFVKSVTSSKPMNPLTKKWANPKTKSLDIGKYTISDDKITQNGKEIGTFKREEESDGWVIKLNNKPKSITVKEIDQFEKKIDKA